MEYVFNKENSEGLEEGEGETLVRKHNPQAVVPKKHGFQTSRKPKDRDETVYSTFQPFSR